MTDPDDMQKALVSVLEELRQIRRTVALSGLLLLRDEMAMPNLEVIEDELKELADVEE